MISVPKSNGWRCWKRIPHWQESSDPSLHCLHLCVVLQPTEHIQVILNPTVNLLTLFLGKLRPPKQQLTSTKRTVLPVTAFLESSESRRMGLENISWLISLNVLWTGWDLIWSHLFTKQNLSFSMKCSLFGDNLNEITSSISGAYQSVFIGFSLKNFNVLQTDMPPNRHLG